MNKPEYIGEADWKLLHQKYGNDLPQEIEKKLLENYPIQYLIGNVDFYNSNILVNENVLIPRFETELLVKKTIDYVKSGQISPATIIDLATGSGAIAISLSKEFMKPIDALDISKDALSLAIKNSKINNTNINFIQADILNDEIQLNHTLIISNPPYVRFDEIIDERTKYEPKIALYADKNGLEFYERIIKLSTKNKQNKFTLAFEIGDQQGNDIKKLIYSTYPKSRVLIEKDYTGKDRFIFGFISKSE